MHGSRRYRSRIFCSLIIFLFVLVIFNFSNLFNILHPFSNKSSSFSTSFLFSNSTQNVAVITDVSPMYDESNNKIINYDNKNNNEEEDDDDDDGYYINPNAPVNKHRLLNGKKSPQNYDVTIFRQKAKTPRENATFFVLARNKELQQVRKSIKQVEDRFNKYYNYPWVFLNDEPFTEEFILFTQNLVSGEAYYDQISEEHWKMPDSINRDKAIKSWKELQRLGVIYGDSESYRNMCRFFSSYFYKHPLMQKFTYYWRVEPGTSFSCDVLYDPFKFMRENKKIYAWTISLREWPLTIPSLWKTVQKFVSLHPEYIAKDNAAAFIQSSSKSSIFNAEYNLCHFWSNFEIADMRFFRGKAYTDYIEALESTGNFYYERWGDAPIHSIAASLFLPKSALHWFGDMGYSHPPFEHCPTDAGMHDSGQCFCNPADNFDEFPDSCLKVYREMLNPPPEPENDPDEVIQMDPIDVNSISKVVQEEVAKKKEDLRSGKLHILHTTQEEEGSGQRSEQEQEQKNEQVDNYNVEDKISEEDNIIEN